MALKRLWLHEIHRVYYDRLIDDADRLWFYETAKSILVDKLDININKLCPNLVDAEGKVCELLVI